MVKKHFDSAKTSTTHAIKAASKRAIPKTAEATDDLICNKIADEIISISKKSSTVLQLENDNTNDELEVPKKDTFLQKKGNKLLMNQD